MSALRPLRGACQCGRNRYIIAIPEQSVAEAEVHFNTEPEHRKPPFVRTLHCAKPQILTSNHRDPSRHTPGGVHSRSSIMVP
jgi:hypothetical protein